MDLAREVRAGEVHFSSDVSPSRASGPSGCVRRARSRGFRLCGHPGLSAVDETNDGRPYTVFTPFWRAALRAPHREVLAAPRKVSMPTEVRKRRIPSLDELGLEERVPDPVRGGESEARRRLSSFVRSRVERYGSSQDDMGDERTSRLSPYLHFGCLSPREVVDRAHDRARASRPRPAGLCVIGVDYPEPVVDHREARRAAIERYRSAAGR